MDDETLTDEDLADENPDHASTDDAEATISHGETRELTGVSEFRASVDEARESLRRVLGGDGASKLQLLGDLVALAGLAAMLVWMSSHDGGYEPQFQRYVLYVIAAVSPLAAREVSELDPLPRRLTAWWYLGLVGVWLLAGERNFWVTGSIPLVVTPALGLLAHRIWRRTWGPTALFALLLLSWGAFAYGGFLTWWGDALVGRQPIFRPLSWHNQSGTLMAAFGVAFVGASLAAKSTIAALAVACGGVSLATAYLAGSRGAVGAAVVGLVVVLMSALRGRVSLPALALRLGGLAFAAAIAVVGLIALEAPDAQPADDLGVPRAIPSERVGERSLAPGESLDRRLLHMEAALGMFLDRPLRGQGIGSYQLQSLRFTDPDARLTRSAHNEYAEMIGEGGLLFGLPFLFLLGLVGVTAARHRVRPPDPEKGPELRPVMRAAGVGLVVVIGAHALIDFDWLYPVLPGLLAVGAATMSTRPLVAVSTPLVDAPDDDLPHVEAARPGRAKARVRTALIGAPVVLALAAVAFAAAAEARSNQAQPNLTAEELAAVPMSWQGERALNLSLDLARAGATNEATELLTRVIAWNPAVDEYVVLRDAVRYRAGDLSGTELVESLAGSSAQFRAFNLVAEALIDGGDVELALGVLDVVRSRYDRYANWGVGGVRAESLYLVVRAHIVAGDCDAARSAASTAVESGTYAPNLAARELDPLVAACDANTEAA